MTDRGADPPEDTTAAVLRGVDRERTPAADDRERMFDMVLRAAEQMRSDNSVASEAEHSEAEIPAIEREEVAVVETGPTVGPRHRGPRWIAWTVAAGLAAAVGIALVFAGGGRRDDTEGAAAPTDDLVMACQLFAASTSLEGTNVSKLPGLITVLEIPLDRLEAHLATVEESMDQLSTFLSGPVYTGYDDARNAVDELVRARLAVAHARSDIADGNTEVAIGPLRSAALSYLRAVGSIGQLPGGGACGA